jgi:hypothetical protein
MGRPRNVVVADIMRCTRASYHYAIGQVEEDDDLVVREKLANALVDDPSRNFWAEVRKIRSGKLISSKIIDGCTDESLIAQLFALNYRRLYCSVPYNAS